MDMTADNKVELKPCPTPWCRSTDLEVVFVGMYYSSMESAVRCKLCEVHGPIGNNPTKAKEAWNRRPSSGDAIVLDELIDAAIEHRELMDAVRAGKYKPDAFTSQPLNNAIADAQAKLSELRTTAQPATKVGEPMEWSDRRDAGLGSE